MLFLQVAYQTLRLAAVICEMNTLNVEGWSPEVRSSRFASYVAPLAEAVGQLETLSWTSATLGHITAPYLHCRSTSKHIVRYFQ